MNRQEFESTYLNKYVEITFYDDQVVKGILEKFISNEYPNLMRNYYSVGNHLWFRKSHIKKIKLFKKGE